MIKTEKRRIIQITIAVVALLFAAMYYLYRVNLLPPAKTGKAVVFVVSSGQTAPQITANLKAAGLIRDRNAFITYINFHGQRRLLKAGTYSIAPTLSAPDVANILSQGKTLTNRLVVPEGFTIRQIEQEAALLGIPATEFEAALNEPHNQSFLATKPATVDLEGYLFPDSYTVTSVTTGSQLVNAMLDNFGLKVGPEYAQAFTAEGLTLHQGLTIASIVEREVNIAADRPIVAQIFLKRYHEKIPLGSDVTAVYAAQLLGVPFDVNLNSPYNTRKVVGLPPGPISNPGLSALDAVAHPASTDYTYFLTGRDGRTYFAKTYSEHQANIAKYLN
jgi:UPF0755 protein